MRYRESSVLAADGRPILVATEPPYRAGGTGRRFAGFIAPTRLGPNAALLPHLDLLRARSRALYRNNPLIKGAIEKKVANFVGWGITPQPMHDNEATRIAIARAWTDWAKQIKLDALQKRAARECELAGEVFLRIRPRRKTDTDALGRRLLVPMELQLIEAEHCPTYENRLLSGGRFIRAGIEFDAIGRRTAYWMHPQHPGDGELFQAGGQDLVPVPASEVVHLFDPDSPEAIRGVPGLSRVLLSAHDLDAFYDATLQRQAISALFAGFVTRPEGGVGSGILGETPENPEPTFEPGTIGYLGEGEQITFPTTPDPGANFAPFVKAMHLLLSSGIGLTYEQVSNDLSSVNYSSIRAGSLEFRRQCEVWQYTTFCPEFLEPIWVHWLRRAQLAGVIDVPELATNEIAAGRVEWITQGWDWVDPLKEVDAAIKSVQAGFDTREGVNISRGNDPRRIEQKRAEEVRRAKQMQLEFTTDVPEPTAQQPAPTRAEEPDDDEPRAAQGGRRV